MTVRSGRRGVRWVLSIAGAVVGGFVLAASVVAALHFTSGGMGAGQDAHAYWLALRSVPYEQDPGAYGAYLYSPAFTQFFSPLLSLAFPQFMALWTFLLLLALLALAGPLLFVVMLPFAFFELWGGNITLFLALALVVGFRHPAAWSFALLTKVTPGLGLLWFAVRREWHALLLVGLATAAIAAASWLVAPAAWSAWLAMLVGDAGMGPASGSIPIPLVLRLPLAVLVIVVAALRDKRWLLPFGVLLAMPVLWFGSLTLLIASVALERERLEPRVEAVVLRVRAGATQLVRQLVRRAPAWTAQPEH